VHLSARRAREINAYYHSLGEGLGRYTPPLVDRVESNKPLSIALEEIAQGKIVPQEPGEAMRVAEQLLGGEEGGAEVVSLDLEGDDEAAATAEEAAGAGGAVSAEEVGGEDLAEGEPEEDEAGDVEAGEGSAEDD
jgi:DNA-directed RNA polymerase subunit omega